MQAMTGQPSQARLLGRPMADGNGEKEAPGVNTYAWRQTRDGQTSWTAPGI
jgi:hypothetical protein